jgi:hypothetical protein
MFDATPARASVDEMIAAAFSAAEAVDSPAGTADEFEVVAVAAPMETSNGASETAEVFEAVAALESVQAAAPPSGSRRHSYRIRRAERV